MSEAAMTHSEWDWVIHRGAVCTDCGRRWPCAIYAELAEELKP